MVRESESERANPRSKEWGREDNNTQTHLERLGAARKLALDLRHNVQRVLVVFILISILHLDVPNTTPPGRLCRRRHPVFPSWLVLVLALLVEPQQVHMEPDEHAAEHASLRVGLEVERSQPAARQQPPHVSSAEERRR